MHSWLLQIAATAAATLYIGGQGVSVHLRRRRSWDDLLARLIPDWRSALEASPEASGDRKLPLSQAAEIRTLCRDAKTMQAIADYALRNFRLPNRTAAEKLHRDATILRFHAYAALVRSAMGKRAGTNP